MKAITCQLRFGDGRVVTARAASASPQSEVAVEYSGPVERLGAARCTKGSLGFVEWYLRGRARHVNASFQTIYTLDGTQPAPGMTGRRNADQLERRFLKPA